MTIKQLPLMMMALSGLSGSARAEGNQDQSEHYPQVELKTTLGDIVFELDHLRAPKSSENFLRYVREGFYDGTVFHRIRKEYVVQAGRFTEAMEEKKAGLHDPIPSEWGNGLKNEKGTIAVVRGAGADSGQAQFYVNMKDNPILDAAWQVGVGYTVFGRAVQGMEVVEAIGAAKTQFEHPAFDEERWVVPEEPIIIIKAAVLPLPEGRSENRRIEALKPDPAGDKPRTDEKKESKEK